ncbi:MAG: hypothetical protein RIS94_2509 [Pseudomonadota bacterium]|jgi:mono/diheme cytochrome c family protein
MIGRMTMMLGALACGGAALAQQGLGSQGNAMTVGVMQDRAANGPAQALFVEKCAMCHRQMGMGTVILSRRMPATQAMLEQRTDLTGDYVRTVVRTGMGNMPRISRGEVSDRQLDTIVGYLTERRP